MNQTSHARDETADAMEVVELAAQIRKLLTGRSPDIVGGALGEVVAIYLAGQHPDLRREVHAMLLELIDDLVPTLIRGFIAGGVVPPDWLKGTSHEH